MTKLLRDGLACLVVHFAEIALVSAASALILLSSMLLGTVINALVEGDLWRLLLASTLCPLSACMGLALLGSLRMHADAGKADATEKTG